MSDPRPLTPVTEVEETVYTHEYGNNGAGPFWCFGSSALARRGKEVFITGLDLLPDEPPLHNERWFLMARGDDASGWRRVFTDYHHHTREPSPLAITDDGRLYTTANPTLAPARAYSGPARPTFHAFNLAQWPPATPASHGNALQPSVTELPDWGQSPAFTEHSYRSLACDPETGGAFLLNNIGYDLAHWALRSGDGKWIGNGVVRWPRFAAPDGRDLPLRICYPAVVLRGKAVHLFGISDIVEYDKALEKAKFDKSGNKWDYLFCRMFYAHSPDITTTPITQWREIANVEATRGTTLTGDMHVDADGTVHVLWSETNVSSLLHATHFRDTPMKHSIRYAKLRAGEPDLHVTVFAHDETWPMGFAPSWSRFHHTPGGRRIVVATGRARPTRPGRAAQPATMIREVRSDGSLGEPARLNLTRGLDAQVFTASRRTGSLPSPYLDLLSTSSLSPGEVRYARVHVGD